MHWRGKPSQQLDKVEQVFLDVFSHLGEVGDAQEEANGVQYVWFATPIESSDGIEERVKTTDLRPLGVRFESVKDYLLYVHAVFSS